MNSAVMQTLMTVIGGVIGGALAYRGTRSTNKSNTESVYAHSMPDMIEKVQDLLEQLESKNGKIAELTSQVKMQSQTIDILTKQVGKMQAQINRLTGGEKNEEFHE